VFKKIKKCLDLSFLWAIFDSLFIIKSLGLIMVKSKMLRQPVLSIGGYFDQFLID